jgi:Eukaryotic aspartyl protease
LAADLTSVGISSDTASKYYPISQADQGVMLDSGTTISRLHQTLAMPILQDLGAQSDGEGYYVTRCSTRSSKTTINFTFANNATVAVPLSDFILEVGGSGYCYIGLTITTDQQILGESFLRAGYFVFDCKHSS